MPTNVSDSRQNFWPRAGPAGPIPDFGDERPCGNCGYNLRGLVIGSPCPECGSVWGMNPSDEDLPFDDRQTVGSYLSTLAVVLIWPKDLASHVWRPVRMDESAGKQFAHITILLAAIPLCAVTMYLTAAAIGIVPALICLPIQAMSIVVWLINLAAEAGNFFRDKAAGASSQRVRVLSKYLIAPLALTPLHLILIYFARLLFPQEADWPGIMLVHGAALALQMLLAMRGEAWLIWQVVDIPRVQAIVIAFFNTIARLFRAAIYLVGVPALIAMIAGHA